MDTGALRDVFRWARACVERGGLVRLQGWLIHSPDVSRLREIKEVCLTLGLRVFTEECYRLLDMWENGEWDVVVEEAGNDFDEVFRAEELAQKRWNSAGC